MVKITKKVHKPKSRKNTKKKDKIKKKENTNTKISIQKCNPGLDDDNNKSCFDFDALVKIAKNWNEHSPSDKIKIPSKETKTSLDKLWKDIDNKLKNECKSEWCWIEQEFINRMNKNELITYFRPKMPSSWKKNKFEWLSTTDIESVMKQYEDKYHDFKFIGPVPIDFDYQYQVGYCIVDELCNLKVVDLLNKGINKLGIVFNLDPHNKPGSHWVAMYCDFKKNKIYYFDSYGVAPPTEVERLVDRIIEQGKEINKDFDYQYNQKRHQYKNSECGVYSMHFITQLLEGRKSFKKMQDQRITDESMNKKRQYFYLSDFGHKKD